MPTIAQSGVARSVLGGVDTHKEVHVAAVIDDVGRILATAEFSATRHGYRRLLAWLRGFGELVVVGVGAHPDRSGPGRRVPSRNPT